MNTNESTQFASFSRISSLSPNQQRLPLPQKQMTKQEYLLLKNIPSCMPARKVPSECDATLHRIASIPTPLRLASQTDKVLHLPSSNISNTSGKNQELLMELEKEKAEKLKLQEQYIELANQMEMISQENDQIKMHFEKITDEKIRLQNDYEKRIKLILQEPKRNQDDLKLRITELEDQSNYYQKLFENSQNELKSLRGVYESQITEQNSKIVLMSQEIQRLTQIIEDKNNGNGNNKINFLSEYSQLKTQFHLQLEDLKKLNDTQGRMVFHSQIQSFKEQYQRDTTQFEDQLKASKIRLQDMKTQLDSTLNELTRTQQKYVEACRERDAYLADNSQKNLDVEMLKMQVDENYREINALTEKIQIMENRHACEISEMKSTFEFTKRSICDSQLRELTVKFNQDRQQYESQIRSMNQRLIEMENKIIIITSEHERVVYKLQEESEHRWENEKSKLLFEIKEIKSQQQLIQSKENVNSQNVLQRLLLTIFELERMTTSVENKDTQIQLLSNDLKVTKNDHSKAQEKVVLLANELERLNTLTQEISNKAQELEYENQNLREDFSQEQNQMDLLHQELQAAREEIEALQQFSSDQQQKYIAALDEQTKQFKQQMQNENEFLREELEQVFTNENQSLRDELQKLDFQLRNLTSENKILMQKLEQNIQEGDSQRKSAIRKLENLENSNKELQEKNINILGRLLLQYIENERLFNKVKDLNQIVQSLESEAESQQLQFSKKYDLMQQQYDYKIQQYNQQINTNQKTLEERIALTTSEVERLQQELRQSTEDQQKAENTLYENDKKYTQYLDGINKQHQQEINDLNDLNNYLKQQLQDQENKTQQDKILFEQKIITNQYTIKNMESLYNHFLQEGKKLFKNMEDRKMENDQIKLNILGESQNFKESKYNTINIKPPLQFKENYIQQ